MSLSIYHTARALTLCVLLVPPISAIAQETQQPAASTEPEIPEISDEPRTINPATIVPEKLAAAATVVFTEASLREIAETIENDRGFPVLFDNAALSEERIPLGEPVTDRLDDEPLYLLLNRLRSLGLAWYLQDEILTISTARVVKEKMSTRPYNAGDLFDAGYAPDDLSETILSAIDAPWEMEEGEGGSYEWLGDVLFVRQNDLAHRQIMGLLAALRNHSRRTFAYDPPQHAALREKLDQNVEVAFVDTPLRRAIEELAEQTGADIRLDTPALRESRVRDREPVSLTLSGRKLETVLHVLLADLQLRWILRDGVLWITNADTANGFQKTAVFDVRDLCRDAGESAELRSAIFSQTFGPWEEFEGYGGTITFAKPGTMVVKQTETQLEKILELLKSYRTALRASKRRDRDAVDPQEFITRYYLMHQGIAGDLSMYLPALVERETWQSENPDAQGYLYKLTSRPGLIDSGGRLLRTTANSDDEASGDALVIPQAVLIIHQTRKTHEEIAKIIERIQNGDPPEPQDASGGIGGGGGGFGGGFFSVTRPVSAATLRKGNDNAR